MVLGCCTAATAFLRKIGSLDRVDFFDSIELVDGLGERLTISASGLPAPFHLAPSILRASCFTGQQKRALAGGLARIALRRPRKGEGAADYLGRTIGDADVIERLVGPMLVSALNEEPCEASAAYARMVILESLVRNRRGSKLGVPAVPLLELVAEPAAAYLKARGCEIRTSAGVMRADVRDGRVRSLALESGERAVHDAYVFAAPPRSLAAMGLDAGGGDGLAWKPIVSAHLFLDARPDGPPQVCVVGEPFGWVFDMSARMQDGHGCVQAVASAAGRIVGEAAPVLTELSLRAVCRAWPEMARARVERAVFCRSRRATFSTGGDCDACRPGPGTTLANAFLAGDWTATRWPATMESAARSGKSAARRLVEVVA